MPEIVSLEFTGERIVPQSNACEPNFASRMYQEHIARYLFAAQLTRGKSVIDIGCGVGYGSQRLAQLGAKSVYAFDLSDDAVQHAKLHYSHPKLKFEVGNAETFSVKSKFDVAVCFELIEHVRHADKVLERIKLALKPDGVLIMSTPRALERFRTHFHEHEFSYEEYHQLIANYFPNVDFYVENNHFSSLITKGQPRDVSIIECLKDQFSPHDADVFIAIATPKTDIVLPALEPVLSIDSDAYVTMLERDVDILHAAENDLLEKIAFIESRHSEVVAFNDAEIARLTGEYNQLFERAGATAASQTEKIAALGFEVEQLRSEAAFKHAEIARLTDEYNQLFERAETTAASHTGKIETLDFEVEQLRSETAFKDAEIARLTGDYNQLFERAETTASAHTRKIAALDFEVEQLRSEAAFKQAEVARLTDEYNRLFERAEATASAQTGEIAALGFAVEQLTEQTQFKDLEITRLIAEYNGLFEKMTTALGAMDAELEQLTADHANLKEEAVALSIKANDADVFAKEIERLMSEAELKNMEIDRLTEDYAALRQTVASLSTRATDAESRRMEAYDFARVAIDQSYGLRRELEAFKREIGEALEGPEARQNQVADHRHRDIVESMARVFPGTEATRHLAPNPLAEQVARMAREVAELREREAKFHEFQQEYDHVCREVAVQCSRAERAEAFAEEWHAQIHAIHRSASWRWTKPLRALGRLFR